MKRPRLVEGVCAENGRDVLSSTAMQYCKAGVPKQKRRVSRYKKSCGMERADLSRKSRCVV